jgi:hypothetical protein
MDIESTWQTGLLCMYTTRIFRFSVGPVLQRVKKAEGEFHIHLHRVSLGSTEKRIVPERYLINTYSGATVRGGPLRPGLCRLLRTSTATQHTI